MDLMTSFGFGDFFADERSHQELLVRSSVEQKKSPRILGDFFGKTKEVTKSKRSQQKTKEVTKSHFLQLISCRNLVSATYKLQKTRFGDFFGFLVTSFGFGDVFCFSKEVTENSW